MKDFVWILVVILDAILNLVKIALLIKFVHEGAEDEDSFGKYLVWYDFYDFTLIASSILLFGSSAVKQR